MIQEYFLSTQNIILSLYKNVFKKPQTIKGLKNKPMHLKINLKDINCRILYTFDFHFHSGCLDPC